MSATCYHFGYHVAIANISEPIRPFNLSSIFIILKNLIDELVMVTLVVNQIEHTFRNGISYYLMLVTIRYFC